MAEFTDEEVQEIRKYLKAMRHVDMAGVAAGNLAVLAGESLVEGEWDNALSAARTQAGILVIAVGEMERVTPPPACEEIHRLRLQGYRAQLEGAELNKIYCRRRDTETGWRANEKSIEGNANAREALELSQELITRLPPLDDEHTSQ